MKFKAVALSCMILAGVVASSGAASAELITRGSDGKDFSVTGYSYNGRGLLAIYENTQYQAASTVKVTATTALQGNSTYDIRVTLATAIQGTNYPTVTDSNKSTTVSVNKDLGTVNTAWVYSATGTHQIYLNGVLKGSATTSTYW